MARSLDEIAKQMERIEIKLDLLLSGTAAIQKTSPGLASDLELGVILSMENPLQALKDRERKLRKERKPKLHKKAACG